MDVDGLSLLMFINGGAIVGGAGQALELGLRGVLGPTNALFWAVLVAAGCGVLLLSGQYRFLERASISMVATFTLITVTCTCSLQWSGNGLSMAQLRDGLNFSLPTQLGAGVSVVGLLLTSQSVFAATGIGSWEMMHYTYWCVEKGYARNVGANAPGAPWSRRARGWIRVIYCDAILTMLVFTVSTVCFYYLGAAILYPTKDPQGLETFTVLFSTTFSSTAGTSRLVADAFCVMGLIDSRDYHSRLRCIRV